MVTRTVICAAIVVASAACAHAQEPPALSPAAAPAQQQPSRRPDAPQPPVLPDMQQGPPPSPRSPAPVVQMTPEQIQRIYHIRQLEGVLTNAVKAGASSLAYQMQVAEPSLFVTTNARTRGFELDGYGVFFDVDVPAMLQSAVWAVQARTEQQQYLDSLRATAADPKVNPATRRVAEFELRRVERMLGLQPSPLSPSLAAPPSPGVVTAATTDAPAAAEARPAATVAPLPDLRDPNERYTEAIKDKLIDVMLAYGTALRLEDQEWLVIAARATNGDTLPGQLDDAASILLRIKGEDLNAHAQKKLTREEVIKRIEIKIG
jgi:hypothetical protein